MKEAQRLADKIASLLRFLPRIIERARPIMKLLKKAKKFVWDEKCKEAFRQLKVTLVTLLVLSKLDTRNISDTSH